MADKKTKGVMPGDPPYGRIGEPPDECGAISFAPKNGATMRCTRIHTKGEHYTKALDLSWRWEGGVPYRPHTVPEDEAAEQEP